MMPTAAYKSIRNALLSARCAMLLHNQFRLSQRHELFEDLRIDDFQCTMSSDLMFFLRERLVSMRVSKALRGGVSGLDLEAEARPQGSYCNVSLRRSLEAWRLVPMPRNLDKSHSKFEAQSHSKFEAQQTGYPGESERSKDLALEFSTKPARDFLRDSRTFIDTELPGLLLFHHDELDQAVESLLNETEFQGATAAEKQLRTKHLKRLDHYEHRSARARLASAVAAGR